MSRWHRQLLADRSVDEEYRVSNASSLESDEPAAPAQSALQNRENLLTIEELESAQPAPVAAPDTATSVAISFAAEPSAQAEAQRPASRVAAPKATQPEEEIDVACTDPSDFGKLTEAQLFQVFGEFRPLELQLETLFCPFLPEYQPAIGDVDPFVKPDWPRPDPDFLGLKTLDEPVLCQSSQTVLEQQLCRLVAGCTTLERSQRETASTKEEINQFTEQLEKMRAAFSQTYESNVENHYFETQLFDERFCAALEQTFNSNWAKLDLSTVEFLRLCCALLDVAFDERDPIGSCWQLFATLHEIRLIQLEERTFR